MIDDAGAAAAPVPALTLTILMPCLNEAETVETCVRKARGFLDRTGIDGEVLVADNGSEDGSQDLAMKAGARVVPIARKGYGAALQGGIAAAEGKYVIMGDADDSYDFAHLEGFVEALQSGTALVMGNRFKGGIQPGAMPFLNRFLGNPVLSFLGRLFYGIPVGDFHCGLRGFSKSAILGLDLQAPGMEFASEMVVKASLAGLSIAEVPTTLSPDGRSRPPHLRPWRDGWRHLRFLLLHSPRWLFLYPGLAMLLLGMLLASVVVAGDVEILPGIEIGIHTLITGCFAILIGGQLISFAVLARRHTIAQGILPPDRSTDGLKITLERILVLALGLLITGVIGFGIAVGYWIGIGFGAIEFSWVQKLTVISLTVVTIAIQLAFTGFLVSAFALEKK
ncbi:MAG: glycosyltransferase family 2 protein [Pseudomonadota bacterium]